MDELIAQRKNILMLAKANSLLPKILTRLPDFDGLTIIHTFHPHDYEQFGMPVRILEDGETMEL